MSDPVPPSYNPHSRQPQTLGELKRWVLALEASQRPNAWALMPGVPLRRPPKLELDRLDAYCQEEWGLRIINNSEDVDKLVGKYLLKRNVARDDAEAASFQAVADALIPTPASGAETTKPGVGKRRRRSGSPRPTPLTPEQTEAMQLVGENKGDVAAAARQAGKS